MQCFDFKGGIGTASRVLPTEAGGYTVGVLVMTNHGDREVLLIDGVRVGEQITDLMPEEHSEGSCIVIVATDAPLMPHQLAAGRAARGHGPVARGFVRVERERRAVHRVLDRERGAARREAVQHRRCSPTGTSRGTIISSVFKATIEATEEAVLNALLASHTMTGRDGNTLHALPVDRLLAILRAAGRVS